VNCKAGLSKKISALTQQFRYEFGQVALHELGCGFGWESASFLIREPTVPGLIMQLVISATHSTELNKGDRAA